MGAGPGIIDGIYNEFFSPEAKERRIKLRQDKAAEKFYNSPEFLKMTGGVPVGALGGQHDNLQNQQIQEAIRQLHETTVGVTQRNTQDKAVADKTGGMGVEGARFFEVEKPESAANIDYKKAATKGEAASTTRTEQQIQDTKATTKELGAPVDAFNAKTARTATAGANSEHLAMVQQMMSDPKQRNMLISTLKTAGFDTSHLEGAFAQDTADRKSKLDQLMSLDKNGSGGGVGSSSTEPRKSLGTRFMETLVGHPAAKPGEQYVGDKLTHPFADRVNQITGADVAQQKAIDENVKMRSSPTLDLGSLFSQPVGSSLKPTNQDAEDPIQLLHRIMQQAQQ